MMKASLIRLKILGKYEIRGKNMKFLGLKISHEKYLPAPSNVVQALDISDGWDMPDSFSAKARKLYAVPG